MSQNHYSPLHHLRESSPVRVEQLAPRGRPPVSDWVMMVVMQTEAGPGPRAIRGIFRATSTRDGEAIFRDGQPYVDINPLGQDVTGRALFEIQFTDGKWMLAVDLDLGNDAQPGQSTPQPTRP